MSGVPTTGALANFAPWTSAEDAKLRASYLKGGIAAAVEALPARSKQALFHRVQRLGVKRRARWTAENDAELKNLWEVLTLSQIAKKIGRTEITVYWRAGKLGLERGCQQGHEYLHQACERTGYEASQLRKILKAGGVRLGRPMSRPCGSESGNRFHTVDPLDVDDAVARWHATEIVNCAAEARGMLGETMRSWLDEAQRAGAIDLPNQPKVPKGRWRVPTATIDAAIAWRAERESLSAAAKRVGVKRGQLARWIAEAGIPTGRARPWLLEKAAIDRLVAERIGKAAA